jgi:endonuclease-3
VLRIIARAIATRWRWPPESETPSVNAARQGRNYPESMLLIYSDCVSFRRVCVITLTQLLDVLAASHGEKAALWPTDPYLFLVWLHCGYPASDARCAKGWESLTSQIGADPERILAAKPALLASALKPGGMVPELRATRLKEIAERVLKQYGGDLRGGLNRLSVAQARGALKQFPNIADPGADRVLLFAGISPVAAVPSNCPHVLVRIQAGQERENYGRTYREAQQMIEDGLPSKFDSRTRAYLLLKYHGQQLCKSANPKCDACPVAPNCAFAAGKLRGRPNSVKRKP